MRNLIHLVGAGHRARPICRIGRTRWSAPTILLLLLTVAAVCDRRVCTAAFTPAFDPTWLNDDSTTSTTSICTTCGTQPIVTASATICVGSGSSNYVYSVCSNFAGQTQWNWIEDTGVLPGTVSVTYSGTGSLYSVTVVTCTTDSFTTNGMVFACANGVLCGTATHIFEGFATEYNFSFGLGSPGCSP